MNQEARRCLVENTESVLNAIQHYDFFQNYPLPGTHGLFPIPPGPEFVNFSEAYLENIKRDHNQKQQELKELKEDEQTDVGQIERLEEELVQNSQHIANTEAFVRRLKREELTVPYEKLVDMIFIPYWNIMHSFVGVQPQGEMQSDDIIVQSFKDPASLQFLDLAAALERILDDDEKKQTLDVFEARCIDSKDAKSQDCKNYRQLIADSMCSPSPLEMQLDVQNRLINIRPEGAENKFFVTKRSRSQSLYDEFQEEEDKKAETEENDESPVEHPPLLSSEDPGSDDETDDDQYSDELAFGSDEFEEDDEDEEEDESPPPVEMKSFSLLTNNQELERNESKSRPRNSRYNSNSNASFFQSKRPRYNR